MRPFRTLKRHNKYRAKRTGRYASKREAAYAQQLELEQRAGHVLDWIEQVPIRLPGEIKYVCDFLVFYSDGSTRFVEIKGVETKAWKLKFRLLEDSRPEIYKRLEVLT